MRIIMEKIKSFTITLLFIICLVLLLTKGCDNTKIVEVVKTDTIKTHTVDTFIKVITNNKYITKFKEPKKDTIIIDNTSHIVNTYEDSLSDQNIKINVTTQVEGKLVTESIKYELKYPIIKIHDMVEIKTTEYITKEPKFSMFIGGMIGGNSKELGTIAPIVGFSTNKTNVFYGFNLMNSTHNIGVSTRIFKSKK